MTARRFASLAWTLIVALCMAGAVFAFWDGDAPAAVTSLLSAVVPTTGAVIARHVPRNPIGWSQLAGGLFGGVGTLGKEYGPVAVAHEWTDAVTHPLVWLWGWTWLPGLACALVFTAIWFPDGRPIARVFRPLLLVAVLATLVWSVGLGVATWSTPTVPLLDDTARTPVNALTVGALVAAAVLAVIAVLAAAGLVLRWRRADRLERQQLKWVGSGLLAVAVFVIAGEVADLGAWQNTLGTLSLAAVAVTMGVAVLRHRLYDIDRIVSRTVTYTTVVAVLGALYAGIVLGVGALLPARFGSVGVALATLAVSALFLPLTRRARRVVDRRFNRRSVDARRLVARFAERTRRDVSQDTVAAELLRTVGAAVQPVHATLWVVPR